VVLLVPGIGGILASMIGGGATNKRVVPSARFIVQTVLFVAGVASVAVGAFLVAVPLGFAVAGVEAVAVAVLLSRVRPVMRDVVRR
jgi:hypothetical protein